MVKRTQIGTEATAPEGTMVVKAQVDVVHAAETTLIPLQWKNPTSATTTASQDSPASPSTAKTPLLLTTSPKFDRIATEAASDSVKSSAAHNQKLHSEELSTANVLSNAAKV